MLEKTMKKSIKKNDFTAKKGFFIRVWTKAFIWTAKVSIILSEKNDLREFWVSSHQLYLADLLSKKNTSKKVSVR
jgi:hypothetical protein